MTASRAPSCIAKIAASVESAASITARMSSMRDSNATPPTAGSERPEPRLSKSRTRANDVSSSISSWNCGMSQLINMSSNPPRT
jgi:hypothetical protein